MISIRVAPTQYLGKVVPSIRPYPSGIFDLNMACWTIHKDSPEKEVPGYPHFSSIYTLCFFHYKPTSYWASPIYGNPHLVRCFFFQLRPSIDRQEFLMFAQNSQACMVLRPMIPGPRFSPRAAPAMICFQNGKPFRWFRISVSMNLSISLQNVAPIFLWDNQSRWVKMAIYSEFSH